MNQPTKTKSIFTHKALYIFKIFTKIINKYKSLTIFRFLIAGIINTIVGLSLGVFFLIVLPFHYALSIFISTFLGVCLNYFMSLKYVFRAKGSNYKIILYFLVNIFYYPLEIYIFSVLFSRLFVQLRGNKGIKFSLTLKFINS